MNRHFADLGDITDTDDSVGLYFDLFAHKGSPVLHKVHVF
jgi:hypothetical protein